MIPEALYTVFLDTRRLGNGSLPDMTLLVKKELDRDRHASLLVFDDETGKVVDLDLRELAKKDLENKTAGRPKLGVVAREITLLPRHWDWLALQPGGASITLRKLVEEAKKKSNSKERLRQAQEATYQFMRVMAGDRPGYEEALRAIYSQDTKGFQKQVSSWPKDVQGHLKKLSQEVWP